MAKSEEPQKQGMAEAHGRVSEEKLVVLDKMQASIEWVDTEFWGS